MIDNCQLTDLPFLDLDPRLHLIPEPGFELYERGSYGHGCEPNHFGIGFRPGQNANDKIDQRQLAPLCRSADGFYQSSVLVCYVGYGAPATLLPQASTRSLRVGTEAECKAECTKARDKTLFQCMSVSFRYLIPLCLPSRGFNSGPQV